MINVFCVFNRYFTFHTHGTRVEFHDSCAQYEIDIESRGCPHRTHSAQGEGGRLCTSALYLQTCASVKLSACVLATSLAPPLGAHVLLGDLPLDLDLSSGELSALARQRVVHELLEEVGLGFIRIGLGLGLG